MPFIATKTAKHSEISG